MSSVLTEQTFTNATETRAIIDEVINNAFESVCSTMGPNGRYVVINQLNNPKVTKDGVSVAKALDFGEARRNLIAKIITEPSIKTDKEVGDGTTTTVFMTYHLYKAFGERMTFRNIRYLDEMMRNIDAYIGTLIKPGDLHSEDFRNMLMTSSNYESEIVDKILEIFKEHKNPNIVLQNVPELPKDEIEFTKEIKFDGEFGQNNYVPASGVTTVPEGAAYVVVVDGSVRNVPAEFFSRMAFKATQQAVVLIARNFEPAAMGQINNENQKLGAMKFIPYKVQAAGSLGTDTMNDLGKLMGVEPVFELGSLNYDMTKINTDMFFMTATGLLMEKESEHITKVADEILEGLDIRWDNLSIIQRQTPVGLNLARRIGRLRANNVIIKVTGVTPSDATERYYRYEDAMKAAQTGQQFGVIPGIGYGYLMASNLVESFPEQSDEELEICRKNLVQVLRAQYEHLTGHDYNGGTPTFIDLVTGEESDTPMNVFDNAAATMIALKGAWQTAKTLGKISNVMGRSNKSYA